MLGNQCEEGCPACAAIEESREKKELASDGVREIVLGLWLDAIKDGERSLATAIDEVAGSLELLSRLESDLVMGQFVRRARLIKPTDVTKRKRKPRGLPTAWRRANLEMMRMIANQEGLPITTAVNAYDTRTVFHRGSEVWADWGITVTPRQVEDAYFRANQGTYALEG